MSPRPTGLITSSILQAIDHGHRYGADIMDATGQGGGTVYKVLRRLETRGLIRGVWEDAALAERERRPRRRFYRMTAAGRTELAEAVERYRALGGSASRRGAPARGR
jgi:DNA-binding PadR family transcriptional regulator